MEIKDLSTKVLFDETTIANRIKEMGAEITKDFGPEPLVVVGVLKGAFIFLADLIRAIDLPMNVEFIGVASYAGTKSTGHVRLTHDLSAEILGQNVLLVEDVIDSGRTIDYLLDILSVRGPKKIAVASFFSKPELHKIHKRRRRQLFLCPS